MQITRVGLDLAKRVFQVYGVDAHGKAKLSKKLARAEMPQFFAQLPACVELHGNVSRNDRCSATFQSAPVAG